MRKYLYRFSDRPASVVLTREPFHPPTLLPVLPESLSIDLAFIFRLTNLQLNTDRRGRIDVHLKILEFYQFETENVLILGTSP